MILLCTLSLRHDDVYCVCMLLRVLERIRPIRRVRYGIPFSQNGKCRCCYCADVLYHGCNFYVWKNRGGWNETHHTVVYSSFSIPYRYDKHDTNTHSPHAVLYCCHTCVYTLDALLLLYDNDTVNIKQMEKFKVKLWISWNKY